MSESNPEKRVRLGCFVKPSNLAAVKRIKAATGARSEGTVIDAAVELYDSTITKEEQRKKRLGIKVERKQSRQRK